MKSKPFTSFALASTLALAAVGSLNAATYFDSVDDIVYSGGVYIGLNGGTGFGAWSGSATGNGGSYMNSSGLSASTSWGIYAGGDTGNSYTVTRPFASALGIGETFTMDFGYTDVATGGEIGINLFSGGAFRLGLKFIGGGSSWQLNDGGSDFSTGIPWAGGTPGTTLKYSFTRGNDNNYSINLLHGAGIYDGNNYTASSGNMSIDSVQIYSIAQGAGENVGFNNLAIVPEPSSLSLLALSGLALLRRRRA
ncbi:MAG: PEP-CTERM sorting domain-containing protein [Verrucomicrobiota bacterium]